MRLPQTLASCVRVCVSVCVGVGVGAGAGGPRMRVQQSAGPVSVHCEGWGQLDSAHAQCLWRGGGFGRGLGPEGL